MAVVDPRTRFPAADRLDEGGGPLVAGRPDGLRGARTGLCRVSRAVTRSLGDAQRPPVGGLGGFFGSLLCPVHIGPAAATAATAAITAATAVRTATAAARRVRPPATAATLLGPGV